MTLPDQTPKQQYILTLHYQFRFLNSTQIQKFLHHKNKKRINTWLPDLVKKEYLETNYDRHTCGLNTHPAVYFFGKNGIRWLKTQEEFDPDMIRKLAKDKNRSETFQGTCQRIVDICLDLISQNNSVVRFDYVTESDYSQRQSPYYSFSSQSGFTPHLIFTKQKNKIKTQYFLEIIAETLPYYRLKKRIRTYFKFLNEYEWKEYFTSSPHILFTCHTKDVLIRIKRYTKKLFVDEEEQDIPISFALEDDVKKAGITGEVWENLN